VVGAGLGGLTAAAILARAGLDVVVLERQDAPGGLAHSVQRGPYRFDPAVHFLLHAQDGRAIDLLLRHLGVRDRCEFLPLPHAYGVAVGDFRLDVPVGLEAAVEAHARPAPGVGAFLATTYRFFREATHLTMQTSLAELEAALPRYPTFFAHRNATLGDVVGTHVDDPVGRGLAAATWPYLGLPPSRLAFLPFAKLLACLLDGPSYCRGGFQALADAFAAAVQGAGGEVLTATPATGIVVENGRAAGVRALDGELRAGVVVSNADARHTFEELVGEQHLPPPFVRRLRRYEPSPSAFVAFVATRLDVAAAAISHETVLFDDADHEHSFARVERGLPGGIWIAAPTLADPSLAPPGEHFVVVTSLVPFDHPDGWERAREPFAAALLDRVERLLPGLRAEATLVETATPDAFRRHTGAHRGAVYGWAPTPAQSGSRRLDHASPLPGLYLTGHWTHEGSGALPVILSGVRTARLVLERMGLGDRAPVLQAPDMPIPV
jgi:phytoene desaturase